MDLPGDTLDIKPTDPNNGRFRSLQEGEYSRTDAAEAARAKIAALHQPTPAVATSAPLMTSAPVSPAPVSPAANYRARQPKIKKPRGKYRPIISAVVSFLFLMAFFKSEILLSQLHYLTAKPAVQTAEPTETVAAAPVLIIPKININAPVVYPATDADGPNYDKELETGVVHYPNTAMPGQPGNSVIFGHSSNDWWEPGNYKFVFVLLDKLVVGDTLQVNYNSRKYTYTVTQAKVVEPTDLSVLAATPDPTLTLITCTPPGTSWKRLIVTAKQTSPSPTLATTQPSDTTASKAQKLILPSGAPSFLDQLSRLWQSFLNLFKHQAANPSSSPSTPGSTTLPTAK